MTTFLFWAGVILALLYISAVVWNARILTKLAGVHYRLAFEETGWRKRLAPLVDRLMWLVEAVR